MAEWQGNPCSKLLLGLPLFLNFLPLLALALWPPSDLYTVLAPVFSQLKAIACEEWGPEEVRDATTVLWVSHQWSCLNKHLLSSP